jgi:hypothetical protein
LPCVDMWQDFPGGKNARPKNQRGGHDQIKCAECHGRSGDRSTPPDSREGPTDKEHDGGGNDN